MLILPAATGKSIKCCLDKTDKTLFLQRKNSRGRLLPFYLQTSQVLLNRVLDSAETNSGNLFCMLPSPGQRSSNLSMWLNILCLLLPRAIEDRPTIYLGALPRNNSSFLSEKALCSNSIYLHQKGGCDTDFLAQLLTCLKSPLFTGSARQLFVVSSTFSFSVIYFCFCPRDWGSTRCPLNVKAQK